MQQARLNLISIIAGVALFALGAYPLIFSDNAAMDKAGSALVEKSADPDEYALARQIFTKLAAQDYSFIKDRADAVMDDPQLTPKLAEVAKLFPPGDPKSVRLLGAYTNVTHAESSTSSFDALKMEYEYDDRWLVADVTFTRTGTSAPKIAGLHATPHLHSLQEITKFRLGGQDATHMALLVVALGDLAFSALALALCIRTPVPRRKAGWIVATLVGFFGFHFNWTTGGFFFSPFWVHIPVAGFSQMMYEPMIVSLTVPVGAIAFLIRRRSWRNAPALKGQTP